MYFENVKKTKGRGGQRAKYVSPFVASAIGIDVPHRASENMIVRPGEHDQFIKQTYSVYRNDPEGDPQADSPDEKPKEPRKWHLSASAAICAALRLTFPPGRCVLYQAHRGSAADH